MPTVPTLTSQVSPQAAPNFQRNALRTTFAQDIGQGAANVGAVVLDIERQERQKADQAAVVEATTKLTDLETSLLYDPQNGALKKQGKDAFGLPGKVTPEFDKGGSEILQGLKNDRQKQIFTARFSEQKSRLNRELNQHEFTEREKHYDETDASLIASSIEAAGRAGTSERVASELATQRAVIQGMAQRKGWDEATTASKLTEFESGTHSAVVSGHLTYNRFDQAGRYLAANASRMRDAHVETLQRQVILGEEQAFQRSERERKRLGDEITKNGDRLYAEGNLTAGWIEQNRHTLDPEDYRYFYRKLSGKDDADGPGDVIIYSDLRDKAGRGEDVRTEAREALRRGQIRSSDYDRILSEVEGQRPGWYKRGKEFITTSAAVSDLNPDPAAAQRKARMVNDWDDWAQANPGATDADARQASERIVQEFSIIDTSKFTLTKRAPRFLKGSRNAPNLEGTISETVRAFEAGEIDRAEFDRQAALIEEWEEAMRLAPKPKAKTDGR